MNQVEAVHLVTPDNHITTIARLQDGYQHLMVGCIRLTVTILQVG